MFNPLISHNEFRNADTLQNFEHFETCINVPNRFGFFFVMQEK